MNTHLYAFGSVCRGEIDRGSDVDLLACTDGPTLQIDPQRYSIYSYERLRALWKVGNPFAWHLHLESVLLFSSNGEDFLRSLGEPESYTEIEADAEKFRTLFERSYDAIGHSLTSGTFHLSCMFLAVRNFATCHSLAMGQPIFSRQSPLLVKPHLPIDQKAFSVLTRARLLSTRGFGENLTVEEIARTTEAVAAVPGWMEELQGARA